MVVTKKVQDSQMDSKWQSSSTGRVQWPLPSDGAVADLGVNLGHREIAMSE
jgi:hypothetical protein